MPALRLPRPVLVALALVLVGGCLRPARFRLAPKLGAMRDKLFAVIKPPAGGTATVDIAALAAASGEPPPSIDPATEPPPAAEPPRSSPATASARPRPRPTTAPRPSPASRPPRVDRVDRVAAAHPTVFVLRGQRHGGDAFCETHATLEACNAACTSMLRQSSLVAPTPTSPKACACTEADQGC
ncbi:MAG: hypothetical protein R3B06_00570 [Kofleriaceae bacterium]